MKRKLIAIAMSIMFMIGSVSAATQKSESGTIHGYTYTFSNQIQPGYKVATISTTLSNSSASTEASADIFVLDPANDLVLTTNRYASGSNYALITYQVSNQRYVVYKVISTHKATHQNTSVTSSLTTM